jgi:hypothetical protein
MRLELSLASPSFLCLPLSDLPLLFFAAIGLLVAINKIKSWFISYS